MSQAVTRSTTYKLSIVVSEQAYDELLRRAMRLDSSAGKIAAAIVMRDCAKPQTEQVTPPAR